MNKATLKLLAEAISLTIAQSKANGEGKAEGKKLVPKLRTLALSLAADLGDKALTAGGEVTEQVKATVNSIREDFYAATVVANVPKGTASTYAKALAGFTLATVKHEDIMSGHGTDGKAPRPHGWAAKWLDREAMTDEARKLADEQAARDEAAKPYIERLKNAAQSRSDWADFVEAHPLESFGIATENAVKALSAAEIEKMEREARAAKLKAMLDGLDEEAEGEEDAAAAPLAAVG